MDDYFKEELASGKEPNNPFEVEEKEKHIMKLNRNKKQSDSGESRAHKASTRFKRLLAAVIAVIVVILVIWMIVYFVRRSNDGARQAASLSEGIGSQITTAQNAAKPKVTLKSESDFAALNQVYADHTSMTESRKTCKVMGVTMPEWAIICHTEGETLTTVTYYDYTLLEKNVFGTARKSYLDPNLITGALTVEQVEDQLGLEPFSIVYNADKSVQRSYRYFYKDGETGDFVSYIITAQWDQGGALQGISDLRTNYIAQLLNTGA